MQKMFKALIVSVMMLNVLPMTMVQATPTEASEYYYGVEYDWTSLDSDLENLTGLDIQELFTELMDDADDAGFNLDIGQLTTGSTNVYVHQYEDISPQTIQDLDGNNVDVWSRTSDVVLRHGLISDAVLLTDWSETTFGSPPTAFDLDIIASAENILTVDIEYTEYLNADYKLIGADMDIDLSIRNDANLNFDFSIEGDGEEIVVDFESGIEFGYSIASDATWRLGNPSPVYIEGAQNGDTRWNCVDSVGDTGVYGDDVYDHCGSIDGTYSGSADYNIFLNGLPTEELGFDEGQFDISISDSFANQGNYEEDAQMDNVEFDMVSETLEVDLGDGTMTDVTPCRSCPPGNPVMFIMMANVLLHSSQSFGETIVEDFEEEFEDSFAELVSDLIGSEDGSESDEEGNQQESEEGGSDEGSNEEAETIVGAFMDSSIESVFQSFGENVAETFEEVGENEAPEFPYQDAEWAPLWSSEHATIVGVGVYAWDENDNGYVLAGPETNGYSQDLPMTFLSLRYVTGITAQETQDELAEVEELSDLIDVTTHDLSELEDALEEAGADTSNLDLDTSSNGGGTTDGETEPELEPELKPERELKPEPKPKKNHRLQKNLQKMVDYFHLSLLSQFSL